MKKLIALLLAAMLLCSVTASALANASIGPIQPGVVGDDEDEQEPSKWNVVVDPDATPNDQWIDEVAKIVTDQSGDAAKTSLKDILEQLINLPSNQNKSLSDDALLNKNKAGSTETVVDLTDLFVTGDFSAVSDTDGSTVMYDNHGKNISAIVKAAYDELKGSDAENAQILVINPTSGEFALVQIKPEDVNLETGEVKVKLPFLGAFALVLDDQKPGEDGEKDPKYWRLVIDPVAQPDDQWAKELAEAVNGVNDPDKQMTLKELVEQLMTQPVNNDKSLTGDTLKTVDPIDGKELTVDLASADFAGGFSNSYLTNDVIDIYELGGKAVSVDSKLVFEQMKGRSADEFLLLVVDPKTEKFAFVELNPEAFDSETGEVLVKFPFLGAFALIEK